MDNRSQAVRRILAVVGWVACSGCGILEERVVTVDSGTHADGGATATDSGTTNLPPPRDAGSTARDAGAAIADAGSPAVDGGSPAVDAGTVAVDAGSPQLRALRVTVQNAGNAVPGAYVVLDGAHVGTTNAQGQVQWPSVPLAPGSLVVTAPYCQTATQAIDAVATAAVISLSCVAANPLGDQIDISQATVLNSPTDAPSWPAAAQLTTLDLGSRTGPAGADGVYVNFTKRDGPVRWPDVPFGTGSLEYTLWIVLNLNAHWYTSGCIEFWSDPSNGLRNGGPPSGYAMNWYYDSIRWGPMVGHQPVPGELVGFFVTAGDARNVHDHGSSPVLERSNVLMVPFPNNDGAVFTGPAGPPPPPPCGALASGGGLGSGQSLASCDGRFQLTMQADGNLALNQGATLLWSSQTAGRPGATLALQGDGNLVIYQAGTPVWSSGTATSPGASLALQNDGNAVLYLSGAAVWSTGTGGH